MADTKISSMTAASALGGTELIAGVQSGSNVKITTAQVKTFCSASPTLVTPNLGVATGTSVTVTGTLAAYSGTAIPAGGTTGTGIKVSSATNFGVFFGSGAPSLTSAKGSLYLRSDGSTTITRAYIATDSSGTWTPLTTVG